MKKNHHFIFKHNKFIFTMIFWLNVWVQAQWNRKRLVSNACASIFLTPSHASSYLDLFHLSVKFRVDNTIYNWKKFFNC